MLKIYPKLDDVPEALREHYKLEGGQYVPHLSDDHPVIVHNKTLLSEKSAATAKVKELEADIAEAGKSSIPRGHVAVPKAEAELLTELKSLGPVAEVKAKLTEHESLKAEVAKTQRMETQRKVAAALGYNEAAFLQLSNLPDMEIREKDGKQSVIALVKDGDKVVERPATEFVEATYAPLLPALKTTGGIETPGSGASSHNNGADPYASARAFGEAHNKQSAAAGNVASRFGMAKTV